MFKNITIYDVLFIFMLYLMVAHLVEKFLLYLTAKKAIKQAGIIGSTKEQILEETTAIINKSIEEAQKIMLKDIDARINSEVIRIIDAENEDVVLQLNKKKK